MDGTFVELAPQAHCYLCGATEIAGICHHCTRVLCSQHLPAKRHPLLRQVGRILVNLRFVRHLPDERNVHCQHCHHDGSVEGLLMALALALGYAILGIVLVAKGYDWAVSVILVGLLLVFVTRFLSPHLGKVESKHTGEPVYLTPRIDGRAILEKVSGHVLLDEQGEYEVKKISAIGRRTVKLSFGEADRDNFVHFLKKHKKLAPDSARFRAGFAITKGRAGASMDSSGTTQPASLLNPVQVLLGTSGTVPMLMGISGYDAGLWTTEDKFTILRPIDAAVFPVQLVPSLRPDTGRQALDLTIQWLDSTPIWPPIVAHQITYLSLHYPSAWGRVMDSSDPLAPPQDPPEPFTSNGRRQWRSTEGQSGQPPRVVGAVDNGEDLAKGSVVHRLMGQDVTSEVDGHEEISVNWIPLPLNQTHGMTQPRIVSVKFENEIAQGGTGAIEGLIHGFLQVDFYGALSGMTGMEVFTAAGGPAGVGVPSHVETAVWVEYEMKLDNLRYHEILIVPEEQTDKPVFTIPGVPPNAKTVMVLTNALSDEDQEFYVRWIVENPPHTGESANIVNRYWDIGGRFYRGVYSVDFHLVLTGSEILEPGPDATPGTTMVALSVQGTYTNDDMKGQIINIHQRLSELVFNTLDGLK